MCVLSQFLLTNKFHFGTLIKIKNWLFIALSQFCFLWVTTATDSDYTLVLFWCCLLLKNDRGNDIHHQKMHCAATKQNDSNSNNNYNDDDNIDHERDDQRQPRPSAALGKKLNDDLRWRQRWRQQSGRRQTNIYNTHAIMVSPENAKTLENGK